MFLLKSYKVTSLISVAMFSLILTACGGSGGDDSANNAQGDISEVQSPSNFKYSGFRTVLLNVEVDRMDNAADAGRVVKVFSLKQTNYDIGDESQLLNEAVVTVPDKGGFATVSGTQGLQSSNGLLAVGKTDIAGIFTTSLSLPNDVKQVFVEVSKMGMAGQIVDIVDDSVTTKFTY